MFCVAFDESWAAEAVVADATEVQAVLVVGKILSMPARFDKLPSNDRYYAKWDGRTYRLVRRSDGVEVAESATIPGITRELDRQYPTVVSGAQLR